MIKKSILLFATLFLSGFMLNALATSAPHTTSLKVTIINNSADNYLFSGYTIGDHLGGYDKPQTQNAISRYTTNNAFVLSRTVDDIGPIAPVGTFTYMDQTDKSTCQFGFGNPSMYNNGVYLISPCSGSSCNMHCSVTSNTTKRCNKATHRPCTWNATITISQ